MMPPGVKGIGFNHRLLLVIGISVLCHALALPNEDVILLKLKDALSRIKCLEDEQHRYQIDETYCGKVNRAPTKIVGGENTEINEYPWQAAVVRRGSSRVICGGSLLNSRFVITAAHCKVNISDFQIILGNHLQQKVDQNELRVELKRVITHPNYDSSNMNNDFALLEIFTPLNLNGLKPQISPVCLPRSGTPSQYNNVTAIITGWGTTSSGGSQPNILQEATVDTMSNTRCSEMYGQRIMDSMICAAYPGRDTCQGDSGGPLVTKVCDRYFLVGVTSWGKGCAEARYPGVYGRITEILDWIDHETSPISTVYACETVGEAVPNLNISCSTGYAIKVNQANYGRTSARICKSVGESTTSCRSATSYQEMVQRCGGQNSCTVPPSNSVFGDPCPGVRKYLEVKYECVPDSNHLWHSVGNTDSFVRFDVKVSWTEGRALCKRHSLDLYIPADPLAIAEYLNQKFGEGPRYWIGGRGNGKKQVWISEALIGEDKPWKSRFISPSNASPHRCTFLHTGETYINDRAVLAVSNCADFKIQVLCG